MADTQAFINEVLEYATAVADNLHIPVSDILAQMINETGSGTSKAWQECNNPAGISTLNDDMKRFAASYCPNEGEILKFPDRDHSLLAYIARWQEPVYEPTRQRWAQNNESIAVAEAMQDSPWAAGHYDHHGLVDLIHQYNLTQYDHGGSSGHGGEQTPCAALPVGPPPEGHSLLKVGSTGSEVVWLQEELERKGFTPSNSKKANGQFDGIFGSATAEAVANFQSANGLHRDGIVGKQTYCALGIR